jgi:hypothetical protein
MIALDWDGVLIDHPPNISFEEILTYPPMPFAVKVLTYLRRTGLKFYVLTARKDEELPAIRKWLKNNGFWKMEVTNKKQEATLYLDDRAYRFTNWIDIGKLLR